MNPVYYYRTERADVRKAYFEDTTFVARIEEIAKRFAAQFNAVPVYTQGFESHFVGIAFDKTHACYHPDLWTKPTDKNPCVVPRSPERAGAKMRPVAERLYKQYHDTFPQDAALPRASSLLTVLELQDADTSQLLLVYHQLKDVAYIACSQPLKLEETVASVFLEVQRVIQSPFRPVPSQEIVGHHMQEASNGNIIH